MPSVQSDGTAIHYDVVGEGAPVVLIAGLAGTGGSWGSQIDLFAKDHLVIVPDHRGTGRSERTIKDMTIAQHARDIARVVEDVGCGRVHVIGSSTGGAIAQLLAINHREVLKTITIASSLARADAFYQRQFAMRRRMLADSGLRASTEANALFLFAPEFTRLNPKRVRAWVESASSVEFDREITFARIDMIVGHDAYDALPLIDTPTLVLVGNADFCSPPYFSAELAARIPRSEHVMLEGGHFIFIEKPELFHRTVRAFILRHEAGERRG